MKAYRLCEPGTDLQTVEVWKLLDCKMHRCVDVDASASMQRTEHNREYTACVDCELSCEWGADIRLMLLICRRDVGGRQKSSVSDKTSYLVYSVVKLAFVRRGSPSSLSGHYLSKYFFFFTLHHQRNRHFINLWPS